MTQKRRITQAQYDARLQLIAALRSGRYQQGTGRLQTNKGLFCCQGVGCDLIDPVAWVEKDSPFGDEGFKMWGSRTTSWGEDIGTHYGFTITESDALIHSNDGTGPHFGSPKTFAQIADHMEQLLATVTVES